MDYTLNRRALLAGAAAASLIRPRPALSQTTGVTPIFINWNPWYGDTDLATQQFHQQLSPARWQFRAPFNCTILGPDRITCTGTQANMDTEIQAAVNAGIKSWMWVWYGQQRAVDAPINASLFKAWQTYDSSSIKSTLPWCVMTDMGWFGNNPYSNTSAWQANCNLWVSRLAQPNYLKVGGRPVLFVNTSGNSLTTYFANSAANSQATFAYLRSQSIAAGAGNPYIMAMGNLSNFSADNPPAGKILIAADAVSSYVASSVLQFATGLPETMATLMTRNAQYWASSYQVGSGQKTVPMCMLGWDKRPRYELPGFSDGTSYIPWVGHQQYYTRGTNAEIASNLQACINFIGSHQPICDSKIMLVYAWNECAEGGTAGVPTLTDPPVGTPPSSNLLNAIKPVLTAAA